MHTHNGTIIPPNRPFTMGDKQYPANWLTLATPDDLSAAGIVYTPDPPVVPPIPRGVSMRQARLALLGASLLDSVNTAVASMAGPSGDAARIEWEYAATVERNSPLVDGLTAALGFTTEQLDALFTTAGAL